MVEIKYTGKKKELLEKIMSLNREAFSIPETHDQLIRQQQAQQEYNQLLQQYLNEPYIIENSSVMSNINYKVDFGIDTVEFKHGQTNAYSETVKIPISIKYDNDGFPCELNYTVQDDYLRNAPLTVKVPIKVPRENIIVKTEVIEKEKIVKVPTEEKKTVIPIFKCKRCGKDLSEELKSPVLACRNCGLPLIQALSYENLDEKQNKKRKWF
jgi:DNA-directed RNA polymerase subunit RPC12/RpoP